MQHNVYLEWSINGKAYFQAFRALCRMRIVFAKHKQNQHRLNWTLGNPDERNKYMEKEKFWSNVESYWKKKLEESITKEKEYFGE